MTAECLLTTNRQGNQLSYVSNDYFCITKGNLIDIRFPCFVMLSTKACLALITLAALVDFECHVIGLEDQTLSAHLLLLPLALARDCVLPLAH